MVVETLREAQTKKHCHPLLNVKIEAINVTRGEVKASKVAHTWADTAARVEIRTVDDAMRQLAAVALINTSSDALT